jgi:hypothetical protein
MEFSYAPYGAFQSLADVTVYQPAGTVPTYGLGGEAN